MVGDVKMYANMTIKPIAFKLSQMLYIPPGESPALISSICPLGESYANKQLGETAATLKIMRQILLFRRKQANDRFEVCKVNLNTYFNELPFKVSEEWRQYIMDLVYLTEMASSLKHGIGNCGEGAYNAAHQSIIKQLTTGNRESIQILHLSSDSQHDNHGLVIFNAKPISPPDKVENIREFFGEFQSENPQMPVIFCDPWAGIYGHAVNWLSYFRRSFRNSNQDWADIQWKGIQVEDYSIPSFNRKNEMNSQERKPLKRLMLAILEGEVDYECHDINQALKNTKKIYSFRK